MRDRQEDDEPQARRGGGSTTWARDEKGRRYRDRGGERYYQNSEDRDAAVEERYRECGCCASLLVRVSHHAEELVDEYLRWCRSQLIDKAFASHNLANWEEERFGAKAYGAAHGRLLFLVGQRVFKESKDPFWKDADEQARYERAVKAAPPAQYGKIDFYAYLREIAQLATGITLTKPPVKQMPDAQT